MSYDNKKHWFDEYGSNKATSLAFDFSPNVTMCLAVFDKGMKWHKKDRLFEDCYGVYWPEDIVFAVIDKLIRQTILSTETRGLRLTKISAGELIQPSSSLIDEVTHLSLEGFDEYLREKRKVVING